MNIDAVKDFAKNVLKDDATGHDWQHALRVEANAHKIAPHDLSNEEIEIIRAACWLHDTIDEKIADDIRQTPEDVRTVLKENNATAYQIEEILYIIQNLSFSKNLETKHELSLMGQIAQDADRLDAVGAIGIARTFYFGGHKGSPIYDEVEPRSQEELTVANYRDETSVINHFYEKLLLLEDTMNTEAGIREAKKRIDFMKAYLEQFYHEISTS